LVLIDNEALRVALVVDKDEKLIGIVSDGDIRRGLLNNMSLDSKVIDVMNRSPIIASPLLSRADLVDLMREEDIVAVPLVDDGRVVGLETVTHALESSHFENPVFLMAGGLGTRLKPLTDNCPKPMLMLDDKPILEILLQSLVDAGFVNFYISTCYMPEKIRDYFGDGRDWGATIVYVHEDSPLGTGGALGLLPTDLPDLPVLMMNGDILTSVNFQRLLEFHNKNCSLATMCVWEYEYQIPYGVIEGNGTHVINMVEKPVQRLFVNAGIYVINQDLARSVPENCIIDMPTLLEQRMEAGEDVLMFPVHEFWRDIGQMDDLKKARVDVRSLAPL